MTKESVLFNQHRVAAVRCEIMAEVMDQRAEKATAEDHESGQYGNWCHDSEILRMAARILRREETIRTNLDSSETFRLPNELQLDRWKEQARNAISQGQTLNDFVLHAHYAYRPIARKAFALVRKEQGFVS